MHRDSQLSDSQLSDSQLSDSQLSDSQLSTSPLGTSPLSQWNAICTFDQIVPDTGVCALLNGRQVAVFRVGAGSDSAAPRLFAIDNYDPNSGAAVLSRGLVGSIGERIVVASPIYKQHFDLRTGECLEAPQHSVSSYPVRVEDGTVWVGA